MFRADKGKGSLAVYVESPGMIHTRDRTLLHRSATPSEVIIRARTVTDAEHAIVDKGPTNQEYDGFTVSEHLGRLAVDFNIVAKYKALLERSHPIPETGDQS